MSSGQLYDPSARKHYSRIVQTKNPYPKRKITCIGYNIYNS